MRQALDVLEPYGELQWRVTGFCAHLKASEQQFGPDGEGQQQVLRVYFGGIHGNVRAMLAEQIGELRYRYRKKNDAALKAEIDRLTLESLAIRTVLWPPRQVRQALALMYP